MVVSVAKSLATTATTTTQRQLGSKLRRREGASREKLFQVPQASDVPATSSLTYLVDQACRYHGSTLFLASGKKGMQARLGFFLPATSAPSTVIHEREWPIVPSYPVR